MGPQTLVHLATFLFLDPVSNSSYQSPIQARNSLYSQSEYPEVPSRVGPPENGNSFAKGSSFLLNKYLLTLEAPGPGPPHGFFPTKHKGHFEDFGLKFWKKSFPLAKQSVQEGCRASAPL
ncbi:hypothetical protein O181_022917 [Austropuccinia psidii MF-1]|uniref:Uncharacterized protein n=1 Tax=Austropuccinia psidii MF-1 TaxID=1389203 RepID=A0A9Q3CGG6_9BASI|nr:hypothetical protein [Austropuccinia psidii MF-1]